MTAPTPDPQAPTPGSAPDRHSRHLDTGHLRKDLKGRSVRGGAVTMLNVVASFVLSTASTAVLARLLSPHEFGLIGMVMVVVSFIVLFKDMGLSMATVQKDKLTHEQVSTLFWINLAISAAIMLLTMASAPVIAWFFHQPILLWITLAGAPGQLLSGLIIQHQALLRRQMRFTALAWISIAAQVAAATVAITMAWHGYGVWALVGQTLTNQLANLALVWIACDWRPGRPVRSSGVRSMLRFGGYLTAFNFINHLVRNLDNILIGRLMGADELGLYQKAYGLLMLPIRQVNNPISAVAMPGLSRLQDNPDAFRRYYQKAMSLIVFIGIPSVLLLTATADKVVLLLLGDQWTDATMIFLALAPAAYIGTFNVATGWVYNALGTTDRQFWSGLVSSAVVCMGMIIGLKWGTVGVAASLSITFILLRYPQLWYCFHKTPLRIRDLESVLWRPTVASLIAVGGVIALNHWLDQTGLLLALRFAIDIAAFGIGYLVGWLVVPGGRVRLLEMARLWKELRPRPATPPQTPAPADAAADAQGTPG